MIGQTHSRRKKIGIEIQAGSDFHSEEGGLENRRIAEVGPTMMTRKGIDLAVPKRRTVVPPGHRL
jgi:hypothetical protein